jgi:hypothetical protein
MQVPADIRTYQARAPRYTGTRGPWLEHLVEDENLSYEEAMAALNDWQLIPYIDPEHGHMATLLKRNKEVHFAIFRKYRHKGHVNMRRIREFLEPILNEEIFLVTKVGRDEDARFIERLGFQQLGSTIDGSIQTYILNELRPHHATH